MHILVFVAFFAKMVGGVEMYKILGLLLMGSVIAFLGDRIGTRIGKKRLSILGMRPRKTAVLMTMVTGMVITLTTLYITSLLNPNVKAALFDDIASIKKSNQELENRYQAYRDGLNGVTINPFGGIRFGQVEKR